MREPYAELVSCKHSEPSSGAWTTIPMLVGKGGLAHLFSRWLALDGKPSVRLVTCAGLAAGLPRKLATATQLLRDEAPGHDLDAAALALVVEITGLFARELHFHRDGLPKDWKAPADAKARTYVVLDDHVVKVRLFLTPDSSSRGLGLTAMSSRMWHQRCSPVRPCRRSPPQRGLAQPCGRQYCSCFGRGCEPVGRGSTGTNPSSLRRPLVPTVQLRTLRPRPPSRAGSSTSTILILPFALPCAIRRATCHSPSPRGVGPHHTDGSVRRRTPRTACRPLNGLV